MTAFPVKNVNTLPTGLVLHDEVTRADVYEASELKDLWELEKDSNLSNQVLSTVNLEQRELVSKEMERQGKLREVNTHDMCEISSPFSL